MKRVRRSGSPSHGTVWLLSDAIDVSLLQPFPRFQHAVIDSLPYFLECISFLVYIIMQNISGISNCCASSPNVSSGTVLRTRVPCTMV